MLKYITAFILVPFLAYAGQSNPGVIVSGAVTAGHVATFVNPWTIQDGGAGGITALTGDVTASGSGSQAATVAKIAGVAVGTPTGTGNVVFSASPTFTGSVEIGETSPTASLEVDVASTLVARFFNTTSPSSTQGAGMSGYTITPTGAGQRMGFLTFGGASAAGGTYADGAGIFGWADQAWTLTSAQGSYVTIETTPDNSATRAEIMRVTAAGGVGIGTTVAAANNLNVAGSVTATSFSGAGTGLTGVPVSALPAAPQAAMVAAFSSLGY